MRSIHLASRTPFVIALALLGCGGGPGTIEDASVPELDACTLNGDSGDAVGDVDGEGVFPDGAWEESAAPEVQPTLDLGEEDVPATPDAPTDATAGGQDCWAVDGPALEVDGPGADSDGGTASDSGGVVAPDTGLDGPPRIIVECTYNIIGLTGGTTVDSLGNISGKRVYSGYLLECQLSPDALSTLLAAVAALDTPIASYTTTPMPHMNPHNSELYSYGPSGEKTLVAKLKGENGKGELVVSNNPAASVVQQYGCGDLEPSPFLVCADSTPLAEQAGRGAGAHRRAAAADPMPRRTRRPVRRSLPRIGRVR